MTHRRMIAELSICVFAVGCLVAGCKKDDAAEAKAPSAEDRANAVAKLAAFDAHDGKADKVISECLMCGLRMKGSADHASKFEGMTLHFCGEGCKKHFDENPVTPLLTVNAN